jgi:hypothetical protein
MRRLCFSITIIVVTATFIGLAPADEPFYLGHRTSDDLRPLTDEELGSPKQQALLQALAGDPYGHRGDDHARVGCAMNIRRFAIPSNTKHFGGYLVGGGLPIKGDGPFLDEGTFGWDYFGMTYPKRIALNWSHGARYQGGAGAYRTDGPRLQRH